MNAARAVTSDPPPPSPISEAVVESPASIDRVFVYAGSHYGRPHSVLARSAGGREMQVQHLDGSPFTVHICDTEPAPPP